MLSAQVNLSDVTLQMVVGSDQRGVLLADIRVFLLFKSMLHFFASRVNKHDNNNSYFHVDN